MSFEPKKQVYNTAVQAVTLGTGQKTITLGGACSYPFHTFDAPTANPPRIGVELPDEGPAAYAQPGLQSFYAGCATAADMAVRAKDIPGVSFLCLRLDSADPNGRNRSVEECVEIAKAVSEATELPLVIMGCHHAQKDALLLEKIAEALQGKNILLLSAREENYQAISSVSAYGQKLCAESSMDINLAKQLNVLVTQSGVAPAAVVMNVGSAAAGYGFEYLVSTLDRVRGAALAQNDELLQMPIITPVSAEAWSVKETIMSEMEMPQWGDAEERGISMEIATAAACLAAGSDAVILRHPAAIETVAELIEALV